MRRLILMLILLLSIGSSFDAHAYDAVGPWTKVDRIYTMESGAAPFIYFDPAAMPGCYNDRGGRLNPPVADDVAQIYSTILSALIADRDVQVFYDYTGVASGWGMCKVVAIYIR